MVYGKKAVSRSSVHRIGDNSICHISDKGGGGGGGGGGGVRRPRFFDRLAYAGVSWSCGQKFFTMTMAKILT